MMILLFDIIAAYILDLILGDPCGFPHPVRFIGWLIKRTEAVLRPIALRGLEGLSPEEAFHKAGRRERLAGTALMITVAGSTFLLVSAILKAAAVIHPVLFHILNVYFIYSSLAGRCLADEARKVYNVLAAGDLPEARKRLSMLVGRDTDDLSEPEVIRGVIETTAENTVDGILSPLFYAILGSFFGMGAPLAYAFKAVSTLDSMVGYMNGKYIHFGRTSAKTDDAANYLPARLSGLIIPAAAFLCGLNGRKSFSVMLRDRHNHKSPNCAYPEAAFAGALEIRIGGTNMYFGMPVVKPTIGDPCRETSTADVSRAIRLMYAASALALVLGVAAAAAVWEVTGLV